MRDCKYRFPFQAGTLKTAIPNEHLLVVDDQVVRQVPESLFEMMTAGEVKPGDIVVTDFAGGFVGAMTSAEYDMLFTEDLA